MRQMFTTLIVVIASNILATFANAELFFPQDADDLISAINTANSNDEPDQIDLETNIIILNTAAESGVGFEGANGLPTIGADSGNALVIKNGSIIRDPSGAQFRIMRIASGARLYLRDLTLENGLATFGDPATIGNAGGCILNDGTLGIEKSKFFNCMTVSSPDLGGGAIYNNAGVIEHIRRSVFSGNLSDSGSGGAIFNFAATPLGLSTSQIISIGEIEETTFSSNFAGASGGAIYNAALAQIEEIERCSFWDNFAGVGGGAIDNESLIGTIINSTFSNNTTGGDGGGINNGVGGGIANGNNAVATITNIYNCTFAFNYAAGMGGGINNFNGAITNMISNIVGRNFSIGHGNDVDDENSGIAHASYNLISSDEFNHFVNGVNFNIAGTTANPVDPRLGPLQNNGGPTFTRELLPLSPAIDAGANPEDVKFDQRDFPYRRSHGDSTDIGAFELQLPIDDLRVN